MTIVHQNLKVTLYVLGSEVGCVCHIFFEISAKPVSAASDGNYSSSTGMDLDHYLLILIGNIGPLLIIICSP